ncbi:MAG: NAD-binding protein [Nitrospinota bacterium]
MAEALVPWIVALPGLGALINGLLGRWTGRRAHLVAIGEGLMLGKRAGIDVDTTLEAIKASYGNSFVAENEAKFILDGSYDVGFTMALACKDLGLVHELGRRLGVSLELGALVARIIARARARDGDDAQSTRAVKLLEDAVGADLRA